MISKAKIKFIRSLDQKKTRKEEKVFVAEGPKVVGDLMEVMSPVSLFATEGWLSVHSQHGDLCQVVTEEELHKISFLQHPQQVLAIFPQFDDTTAFNPNTLSLALDGLQDPGNLGTIIRIADWFGIESIYCSKDTADLYNPKVVQATMGSMARVKVQYTDLPEFIGSLPDGYPLYGTLLDGKDLYQQALIPYGLIIMGNEGNGISPEIRRKVNHHLLIPNFPEGRKTADSLNVAIATAIICAEFRRRSS